MLADDIIAFVEKAKWTSRQAVIDEFRHFEAERIKYELQGLITRKRLITRNGSYGLEYGLTGTSSLEGPAKAEYKPPSLKPRIQAQRVLAASGRMPDEHVTREPSINKKAACRRALLEGALDGNARKNLTLRSRVLVKVNASQTLMSEVLRDLIAEGIAEKLGDGNQVLFRLKNPSSQPVPTRERADQPTVSSEAATSNQPDNNGGHRESTGCPSPGAAPDGTAGHSTSGAEHPELESHKHVAAVESGETSAWEPEPRPQLPAAITTEKDTLFALRSDGCLQMILEGEEILMSVDATRKLFRYLDVINYDAITE